MAILRVMMVHRSIAAVCPSPVKKRQKRR